MKGGACDGQTMNLKHNLFFIHLHKFPNFYILSLLFVAIQTIYALFPLFFGRYIDTLTQIVSMHNESKLYQFSDFINSTRFFLFICIFIIISKLLISFFDKWIKNSSQEFEIRLQRELLDKLLLFAPLQINQYTSGELCAKFFRDAPQVSVMYETAISIFIPSIVSIIITLCISISKSFEITLFIMIFIPIYIFIIIVFKKKVVYHEINLRSSLDALWNSMINFLNFYSVIKAYSVEKLYAKIPDNGFLEKKIKAKNFVSVKFIYDFLLTIILVIGECFIIIYTGYMVFKDILQIGDIVTYQFLFIQTITSLSLVLKTLPQFELVYGACKSTQKLLNENIIATEIDGIQIDKNFCNGKITINNISFKYPKSGYLFKNFSYEILPGQCIVIAGSNGVGKSTLANLIFGNIVPTSGEIFIDNIPLSKIYKPSYREIISYVQQEQSFFNGTIHDNITLLKDYDKNLLHILELRLGLKKTIHTSNNIVIGNELSGGERQKICLVRALLRKPSILILDELSNHLDSESRNAIIDIVLQFKHSCTIIIISHDEKIINIADNVILLN